MNDTSGQRHGDENGGSASEWETRRLQVPGTDAHSGDRPEGGRHGVPETHGTPDAHGVTNAHGTPDTYRTSNSYGTSDPHGVTGGHGAPEAHGAQGGSHAVGAEHSAFGGPAAGAAHDASWQQGGGRWQDDRSHGGAWQGDGWQGGSGQQPTGSEQQYGSAGFDAGRQHLGGEQQYGGDRSLGSGDRFGGDRGHVGSDPYGADRQHGTDMQFGSAAAGAGTADAAAHRGPVAPTATAGQTAPGGTTELVRPLGLAAAGAGVLGFLFGFAPALRVVVSAASPYGGAAITQTASGFELDPALHGLMLLAGLLAGLLALRRDRSVAAVAGATGVTSLLLGLASVLVNDGVAWGAWVSVLLALVVAGLTAFLAVELFVKDGADGGVKQPKAPKPPKAPKAPKAPKPSAPGGDAHGGLAQGPQQSAQGWGGGQTATHEQQPWGASGQGHGNQGIGGQSYGDQPYGGQSYGAQGFGGQTPEGQGYGNQGYGQGFGNQGFGGQSFGEQGANDPYGRPTQQGGSEWGRPHDA